MTAPPHRAPRAGNALIEFMVVIVIAGILAAVILPRYGAPAHGVDMQEAREQIAGLFKAARMLAPHQDPDGDGLGNWPLGPRDGFPLSQETPRFTYSISQGAGANGDTPFAIRATGKPGTDAEGHTLTLWIEDLDRSENQTGSALDPEP